MSAGNQAFDNREIMDIKAAANYLGVSRPHLLHILAGKVAGVPAIPHVRAGRRVLIRRVLIDQWLLEHGARRRNEHGSDTIESPRINARASQGESMRRRRFQKGSLQFRKHADRRVWVVLYYDEKSERRYHTLGWASEMNNGQADEKRRVHARDQWRCSNGPSNPSADRNGVPRPSVFAVLPGQVEGIDSRYIREPTTASHRKGTRRPSVARPHASTAPAVFWSAMRQPGCRSASWIICVGTVVTFRDGGL
jgi:excisionase family DNA binding protein